MVEKIVDVKSKKVVVGQISHFVFDSVEEAVGKLGAEEVLSLINAQHRTNRMNALRAEKTGKPSKEALRAKALSMMPFEVFRDCQGDQAKLNAWITAKAEELAGLQVPAESDDEDENNQ